MEEDIQILSESRENQFKWGQVAKILIRRNQHQIKNRFIYVLAKQLNLQRKNIREMITRKSLDAAVLTVLEELKSELVARKMKEYENDVQIKLPGFQNLKRKFFSLEKEKELTFYFSLDFL